MADLTRHCAKILSILSQPTRIEIIEALRREERCVTDIILDTLEDQSNTSHHMAVMLSHGIVDFRKEGHRSMYRLKHSEPVLALVDYAKGHGEYAEMCKVLSEQNRVKIVEALRDGELPAPRIVSIVGAERSNVARHLSCLKAAKIVDSRREKGKAIYWLINREYVLHLVDLAKRVRALETRSLTQMFV
jgi:DNA-binding transcriptional ArsR family regulator